MMLKKHLYRKVGRDDVLGKEIFLWQLTERRFAVEIGCKRFYFRGE